MNRRDASIFLVFSTFLCFMTAPSFMVPSVSTLDVSRYAVNVETLHRNNIRGQGVTIAVIDDGIDFNHPDFPSEAIKTSWNFPDNNATPAQDNNGHGTRVAGVVAGRGIANSKYKGIAPAAQLVIVRIDAWYQIPDAIQWCIDHKDAFDIRIIQLSWAYQEKRCAGNCAACIKADEAFRAGLVFVTVAGNEGPEETTIDCPGNAVHAIAVGATDDVNTRVMSDDTLWPDSSRGPTLALRPKPEVVAPGVKIMMPNLGGGYIQDNGTSYAAPHVSGLVALILQSHPNWTPDTVKYVIKATANINDLLVWPNATRPAEWDRGKGIVDAARAVSCSTDIPADQADSTYENHWGKAGATAYLNGTFKIWASGTIFEGDAYAEARLNKTFTPGHNWAYPTFFFGFHDVGYMESDGMYAEFHATLKLWQENTILANTEKEIHHVDWGGAYDADCNHTIQLTYQGVLEAGQQYKLEYGFWTFARLAWLNFKDVKLNAGITALHLTAIDTIGPGNPSFEERGISVYESWYWANNNAGWRELRGDVNGDGWCELMDFFAFSEHFGHQPPDGHTPGTPEYSACFNADINGDGMVELMDGHIISQDCGKETKRVDGYYSWYTSGGGDYTLSQWLCDHDVNTMKGHQITFTFWFRPEAVAPDGTKNYARAEIYYITDDGSNQTINGTWVNPTQLNWYSPSITTTLPANTIAIRITIHGRPDFKAWIDKTSITIT